MNKQVVVAMSGGVDSTAAAIMAKEMGLEPIGVNLKMGFGNEDKTLKITCEKLGIKLIFRDCASAFYQRVLLPSAREYANGRTPNPCCECNPFLKFYEIMQVADQLKIEQIFTGHYAKLEKFERHAILRCSFNNPKDQSYFLYRLDKKILPRINFPLGGMKKNEVRALVGSFNLPNASKPDSQDVCFLGPGENCGEKLLEISKLPRKHGDFIYRGKVVGKHNGLHRYTLGQRQGLGVALGKPAYVISINPDNGNIELETDQDKLLSKRFILTRLNWQQPLVSNDLKVRVRYRGPAVPCQVELCGEELLVITEQPLLAVTPGQAGVLYHGDIVLGGGIITSVMPC